MLKEKLFGASYHAENSSAWAREIADEIKARLKGVGRTKFKKYLRKLA